MNRLPILLVEAETCGEAWEKTLEAVWNKGLEIEQHYKDKMSKEASVLVNITNPLKEPRFSRKDFISVSLFLTGEDKKKSYREKKYVKEVMDGTIDHRVTEGIESYTYHERLWKWGTIQPKHEQLLKEKFGKLLRFCDPHSKEKLDWMNKEMVGINQIKMLLQKAKEEPISRKLQVTTWQPHKDLLISGSPCLQRIWIRIIEGKYLVMETHWRSRDLFRAWGSNVLAMTELGKWIAEELDLEFTQYTDFSNSLHIYKGSYKDVEQYFETIEKRR